MRKLLWRSLVLAVVGFAVVFALEFFLEWRRLGFPGWSDVSWDGQNNAKFVDLLSPMARASNNVLAMLIGTIGLAIPLTATMHTPKLIDIFLNDWINRVVLTLGAFCAANQLWVAYSVGPHFAPIWAIRITVALAIGGWALSIPYFYYVVRFIDPSRFVIRVRDDARAIMTRVAAQRSDPAQAQTELSTRLGQIGTIIIKSLDRNDRDVAAEATWAIKVLLDQYERDKPKLAREWFLVDRADFVGLSDEALEMLNENRTWFEMRCLQQIEHGFLRALHGANDTVSTFSDALRVIACRERTHRDKQALRLCVRFFNNFLREAIKARNLRAVYDVFHQYRRLARELVGEPELLREIGRHFAYYAVMARTYGMVFAPQLALFDLGFVVRRAYEKDCPAAGDLLAIALGMPHRTDDDLHTMAVKAKLILGSFFVKQERTAEAEQVRRNLADVEAEHVARAEAELLDADRSFFEVTDRQLNLEYIPPERRDALKAFCALLAPEA